MIEREGEREKENKEKERENKYLTKTKQKLYEFSCVESQQTVLCRYSISFGYRN